MLELEYRPRAQLDRESIAIYLGFECGKPQAALKAIQEIDAAIDRARLFPESGGRFEVDSLENRDYRTTTAGKYTVYYRFDDTVLTIYRILHQRQDIDTYTLFDADGVFQ